MESYDWVFLGITAGVFFATGIYIITDIISTAMQRRIDKIESIHQELIALKWQVKGMRDG